MSGGFGISVRVETLLLTVRGALLHVGNDRRVVSIGLLGSGVADGKSIRIAHAGNRTTALGGSSRPLTQAPDPRRDAQACGLPCSRGLRAYTRSMRRALVLVASCVSIAVLAGCGWVRPDVVDRADDVSVTGGTCRIEWWLAALNDGATDEAWGVAREALASATVDEAELSEWRELLLLDDDVTWASPGRLDGAAHLEAVRADVRDALAVAGFPDSDRVIEVFSSQLCAV